MKCFLLFNGICLVASISFSYHMKNQSSENDVSSLNDVITTNKIEAKVDTEIWDDYSIDSTTTSTFTETSDITTEILPYSEPDNEDSTGDFSTTPSLDYTTSGSSLKATDIAENIEKFSTTDSTESTLTVTNFSTTTTSIDFPTSVSSFKATDIAEKLEDYSTTGPALTVTIKSDVHPERSTAVSESFATVTSNTLTSWSTKTNTPHLIKIRDQKPALNVIESEANEPDDGPKCGQRFQRIPRVIGGIRSLAGEFPWMVSVRVLTSHFCGGVIINQDWILTAGHCVRRFAPRYWRIRLGGHDVNIDQFRPQWDIPVSKVVLHPKFGTPARYSYDMALMKLQRSIKHTDFAAPICLPENLEDKFDGVNATVVGWGRTDENVEETSSVLQKVHIPVVNNSLCAEYYKNVHYGYIRVRDYQICAGLREGGRDACKGDSGGPLVMEDKKGRYTLLGITSAGVGCGRSQLPGIYSRATYFVPWILRVTGGYTHWPSEEEYYDY